MPWYQTVGILIAGGLALLSLPKLVFDTFDAAPVLRRRMLSTALAAEKATPQGAKEILTAHSEVLANRLAAAHQIRYSGRDKWLIGILAVGVPLVWGVALFVWWPEDDVQGSWPSGVIASTLSVLLGLNLLSQPRVKTVRDNRKLFAQLGCPKELKLLAIPGFRDYIWSDTVTPDRILRTARELEAGGPQASEESALDQVAYVNRAIGIWEAKYRYPMRPR